MGSAFVSFQEMGDCGVPEVGLISGEMTDEFELYKYSRELYPNEDGERIDLKFEGLISHQQGCWKFFKSESQVRVHVFGAKSQVRL